MLRARVNWFDLQARVGLLAYLSVCTVLYSNAIKMKVVTLPVPSSFLRRPKWCAVVHSLARSLRSVANYSSNFPCISLAPWFNCASDDSIRQRWSFLNNCFVSFWYLRHCTAAQLPQLQPYRHWLQSIMDFEVGVYLRLDRVEGGSMIFFYIHSQYLHLSSQDALLTPCKNPALILNLSGFDLFCRCQIT